MLVVAKNDKSEAVQGSGKSTNGRSANKSSPKDRRSKGLRKSTETPLSYANSKEEHFGKIPTIPKKVVKVIQLDVVESYGPVDEVNFGTEGKGGSP